MVLNYILSVCHSWLHKPKIFSKWCKSMNQSFGMRRVSLLHGIELYAKRKCGKHTISMHLVALKNWLNACSYRRLFFSFISTRPLLKIRSGSVVCLRCNSMCMDGVKLFQWIFSSSNMYYMYLYCIYCHVTLNHVSAVCSCSYIWDKNSNSNCKRLSFNVPAIAIIIMWCAYHLYMWHVNWNWLHKAS